MHSAPATSFRIVFTSLAAAALLAGCGSASVTSTTSPNTPGSVADDLPASTASAVASPSVPTVTATPTSTPTASTPSAPETAAPADGLVHVADDENGFSLTLPARWVVVPDKSRAKPPTVTGPQGTKVPPAAATQATTLYRSGAKLIAIAPEGGTFATNVNVLEQPSGSLDPDDIMQVVPSAKKALSALHPSRITAKEITLGGQKAAQIDYAWVVPSTKQAISARVIYALHDGTAYIITISRSGKSSVASTDLIARSIRLG